MTVKTYLWGMGASVLLCFAAWLLVLQNVDPTDTNLAGFIIFYLTLFFALASLFSLGGFYLRRKIFEDKVEFRQVEIAFRQGIFLALTFAGLLILQGQRQLNLYSAFFFVVVVVGAEFYSIIRR
jgi:hypothetical protein